MFDAVADRYVDPKNITDHLINSNDNIEFIVYYEVDDINRFKIIDEANNLPLNLQKRPFSNNCRPNSNLCYTIAPLILNCLGVWPVCFLKKSTK